MAVHSQPGGLDDDGNDIKLVGLGEYADQEYEYYAASGNLNSKTGLGDYIDFCVSVSRANDVEPNWSPDGRQFIVFDQMDDRHSRSILFDIIDGFAVQIANHGEIVGWMLSP